MTPFVFGMLKSYPDLPDIQGLFDLNQTFLVIDIDENRIYKTQKVHHLPTEVRARLIERLRQITQPDVLLCDLADVAPAALDPNQYQKYVLERTNIPHTI
jgi:esterase/lipase superfamily enzyme